MMKFIRHEDLGFILFEQGIDHSQMANWFGGQEKVLSAGFVSSSAPDLIGCFGESTTLRIGVKDSDTKSLQNKIEL